MIGPTGVGKTEIARRLARLAGAPFVKVEASKFTEVGYVGRDVESMIRDLVDVAINMVRNEREEEVQEVAEQRVEERLLDLPPAPRRGGAKRAAKRAAARLRGLLQRRGDAAARGRGRRGAGGEPGESEVKERRERTREKLRALLRDEKLEEREVEVEVQQSLAPGEHDGARWAAWRGWTSTSPRCSRTCCRRRPSGAR